MSRNIFAVLVNARAPFLKTGSVMSGRYLEYGRLYERRPQQLKGTDVIKTIIDRGTTLKG
jgi:hypothetical protein